MTETKTCKCKTVFARPPGMADGTWKQITRCDPCRARILRQTKLRQNETQLGRYEFPKYLDKFLYNYWRTS